MNLGVRREPLSCHDDEEAIIRIMMRYIVTGSRSHPTTACASALSGPSPASLAAVMLFFMVWPLGADGSWHRLSGARRLGRVFSA